MSIKVLHYGLSYNYGGIENVLFSWLNHKPDDFVFDFINDGNQPLAYEKEFIEKGCKIHHIENRYVNPIKRYFQLKKIIEDEQYDFLHMHVMNQDEIGPIIICNKSKKTKVLVHCHGVVPENNSIKEKILMDEFKLFSIWNKYERLSCSKMAGDIMFKNNNYVIIENGIDYDKFAFSNDKRIKIRNKYNIKDTDKVIGHIGRYCVEKNYPFLISTISKLMDNNAEYKLMLIGNICQNDIIINMLKSQNIYEKTIMVGMVQDTSEYYCAMDSFYLPSLSEGLPVSMIEAQISGLKCITSVNVPYEAKITDNIVYCELNVDENVNQLKLLTDNNASRSNIRHDDKYDIKITIKKLTDYYRSLAK